MHYLPVSQRTVGEVVGNHPEVSPILGRLTAPEICALYVVQNLPRLRESPSPAAASQKLLANLIEASNTTSLEEFSAEISSRINPEELSEGLAQHSDLSITLLTDEEIRQRGFLTATREWDWGFAARRAAAEQAHEAHYELPGVSPSANLSREQYRVPQAIHAEIDEHLHVQGYSGTGKSFLIQVIVDLLVRHGVEPSRILVLTRRWSQMKAISAGLPKTVTTRTVNDLASDIMPRGRLDQAHKNMRYRSQKTHNLRNDRVIQFFGLTSIGSLSAMSIARAVQQTVNSFCMSGSDHVLEEHIPSWFIRAIEKSAHTTRIMLKDVVLKTAAALWRETQAPSTKEFQPPVRGFHQIKYATLNGLRIPGAYTHVIVDESHDLSGALLKLLDNSPQACITLGDYYQNLSGKPSRRGIGARTKEITLSHRAGKSLEQVVNPILTSHPIEPSSLFAGNNEIPTDVVYYSKAYIPDSPTTILVARKWAMWGWAQRLAKSGVPFSLLGSPSELNRFVQDCIELYHRGIRPTDRELFRFENWDSLAFALRGDNAFEEIHALLEDGYEIKHWRSTYATAMADEARGHLLGEVADAKNADYDQVMLSPDTVRMLRTEDKETLAAAESALYTAATRVRYTLIAPESLRNWIEDTQGSVR